MESLRADLGEDITAVKTEIRSEIEVINENLGNIEGKMVSFHDGMENIVKDVNQANKEVKLMKIEQRSHSEELKEAFKNRSQNLEENVNSNFLQFGNEVTILKSELKDCSNEIGELKNTVGGLTTLITSLTTMLEKNGPPPIQHDLLDLIFRQKIML